MENPNAWEERREHARFSILAPVKYEVEGKPIPYYVANIRDVSCEGLAFFTDYGISKGSVLRLYFIPKEGEKAIEVRGVVTRCVSRAPAIEAFEVGIRFLDLSDAALGMIRELEKLFAPRKN